MPIVNEDLTHKGGLHNSFGISLGLNIRLSLSFPTDKINSADEEWQVHYKDKQNKKIKNSIARWDRVSYGADHNDNNRLG